MSTDADALDPGTVADRTPGTVDLFWIPLGADADVVRWSGRLFELVSALLQRRPRCDLYHSALVVDVPEGHFTIELAPVPNRHGAGRGVVGEGPVGMRWMGRSRWFRYEIRCWPDGVIPDIDVAVASPLRMADDVTRARRILALLPSAPRPVWGRDELRTGEMWNSNSIVSWVLRRGGIDLSTVHPPRRGRAPGWDAGRIVADRDSSDAQPDPTAAPALRSNT